MEQDRQAAIPEDTAQTARLRTEDSAHATREEMLQMYLARYSENCPVCGYDLRNLQSSRCPECGEELRLRIGAEHPRQGAFIAGLVALAGTAGFGGLMLAIFLISFLLAPGRGARINHPVIWMFVGVFVVSSLVGFGWIRMANWYRKRGISERIFLAAMCYFYVVLVIATVFLILGPP